MPFNGLVVAGKDLFVLPFGIILAIFLIISTLAHALISIPNNLFDVYAKDLVKWINRFRWFEYALSSSIMIVLISSLFGITDIGSLILIFIVNASMNLFGLVMEQLNEAKTKNNWGPFIWGSILGIAPWIVIIVYMTGNPAFDQVPWFVLFGAMQP